ncbi:PhnD/SsuA/transferrin family substrate-binding protein [Thermodesulfobacterium sp. TA1]|uniref:PhnD/SsuA/transferrin family substrate-binding protein n=1 Tax=Thermodesulfobacterium sp. TA1 TaxID=2234087 RepID=UPI0012329D93|nr:PhnD/SsuA/transferrin family substrate-binding protein [Thermodesulfobacterium sp. TA1]QER42637.1 PhnD/SsuA/transferrin family substrate-binding protein [Thermodesulfobacterium sp. TA1]
MSKLVKFFYLVLIFFLLGLLPGCFKDKVQQNSESQGYETLTGPPLVIGVLNISSPQQTLLQVYPLKSFLEKKLKRPVLIDISADFEEMVRKVKEERLHLLLIDPAFYCELKALYPQKIFPLVKPKGGYGESSSVFVTKENSSIERIFDATQKRLALGDQTSSFNYLIPLSMLKDLELSLKDFKKVEFLGQDKRIALSVLIGDHEVGALSEVVAQSYLNAGLKIIKSSEKVPVFLIASTQSLEARTQIKDLLSNLPAEVLKALKVEKLIPAEDRDFDYIRVLIKLFKGKDLIEYGPNTVKVAILPLYSPLTIYQRFEPLMKYLSEKTGKEFKIVIPRNFEEFISLVKKREVHFAYQNPYVYAFLSKTGHAKAIALTVGEDCVDEPSDICGGDRFRGVIIVKKDSPLKTIRELKNKRILIVSPYSAGGFLSQKIYLEKRGYDLKRDFKLIDVKRQERVIIGVYKGEADAGFIRESALGVFGKEVDLSQIRVLTPTEFLPNWPWAVVKADEELTKTVQETIIHLPTSILKNLKVKEFKPVDEKIFEPLKKYITP